MICGSTSPEHYISLISKEYFLKALDPNIYDATVFKIDLDGNWKVEGAVESNHEQFSNATFEEIKSCDIFFPIVHGPHGEDGMLQGFLETLKKPYVGPDYVTCGLAMNKVWTKAVIGKMGIQVANSQSFSEKDWERCKDKWTFEIEKSIPYPLIVKPVSLGSSIGVSLVYNRKELQSAIKSVFELEEYVLIEERIRGREFEICILDDDHLICPRPGEIISKTRKYDYHAKYSSNPIEKIPQANLSKKQITKAQKMAKSVYRAVRAKGFIRIDFFITAQGEIIFSEINPMPGCTPKSLFPRMLQAHGLKPYEIFNQMVINGLYYSRLEQKKNLKSHLFVKTIKHVTE